MLNCHADGSAATEAAAVIWYVCASDMGIRIPVRASHATCCEAQAEASDPFKRFGKTGRIIIHQK